jgi:hypothetical protein
MKDFGLIRFYDDRAIQIHPNLGLSIAASLNAAPQSSAQQFYTR